MRVLVNYHIIVSWQGHTDFCLIHLSYPFVSLAVRGSNKLSYTHFQPFDSYLIYSAQYCD